jgi:hypothetical protein
VLSDPQHTTKGKESSQQTPTKQPITLDSFKIRIPINEVNNLSDSLTGDWVWVNKLTGEEKENEYKAKAYSHNENGIHIRIASEFQKIDFNGKVEEFLTILVTSKTLKERYLQGITKSNVHLVYDYLQGMNLCTFSLESFLNGHLTDVDFKRDFINAQGLKLVDALSEKAHAVKYGRACELFRDKTNQGIQYSWRETNRYKTAPYLKIYSKELDMDSKSREFRERYLSDVNLRHLWRIETTVKNKAHFRQLGIHTTTLKAIMDLDQDQLENVLRRAVKSHLEPQTKRYSSDGIKPDDVVMRNAMLYIMESGLSYARTAEMLLGDLDGSNRTKKRDKLERVYVDHIRGSKQDLETRDMDQIYEVICYTH